VLHRMLVSFSGRICRARLGSRARACECDKTRMTVLIRHILSVERTLILPDCQIVYYRSPFSNTCHFNFFSYFKTHEYMIFQVYRSIFFSFALVHILLKSFESRKANFIRAKLMVTSEARSRIKQGMVVADPTYQSILCRL